MLRPERVVRATGVGGAAAGAMSAAGLLVEVVQLVVSPRVLIFWG
jgi:uncharacterized protein (UPF0261 family)